MASPNRQVERKVSRLLVALALLTTLALPSAPRADENWDRARETYSKGEAAFRAQRFQQAAEFFEASYSHVQHSLTAYFLSCAYVRLNNPEQADKYARAALGGQPSLEKVYAEGAQKIISWARGEVQISMDAKADTDTSNPVSIPRGNPFGRAASETTKGPRAATGERGTLGTGVLVAVPVSDLTGKWQCDDGGTYFVRQVGEEVWWYGESSDGGNSWSNIFHGRFQGNQIVGGWVDVPRGQARNSGEMTLERVEPNQFRAISRTGGFGGSTWTR